jgi:hypothetical protein
MDARKRMRVVVGALAVFVLLAQAAWADTTLDTSTSLSANAALPTSVGIGSNSFTIGLWGQGGNIPATKNGQVTVATSYTMATNGTITVGATTTTITFPKINYNTCPTTGSIPQGCPANPFTVSATLTVAVGTPANTTGALSVSALPAADSGVTGDSTPTVARVQVVVPNSAPSVSSISGAASVNEGQGDTYAVTAIDPDGDALGYTWSVVSGNALIVGAATQQSVAVSFGDGPGSVSLQVVVNDGNGHSVTRALVIAADNVAPSGVFVTPSAVGEGGAIVLSVDAASDPSAADAAAGFTYAFDCGTGAGFGALGGANSASCPTTDSGLRTVRARVADKDGGFNEYSATVMVQNVAPGATLQASSPVDEGSPIGLSFTGATDPSTEDVAAGFTYAFDCGDGAGFGAFGAVGSGSCATSDNGPRTVKGRIRDKDGGTTEYSAGVSVDNLAPTAVFGVPTSVDEGSAIPLALTGPSDPSSADTSAGFTYAFDCGDGNGLGADGPVSSASCATTDSGTRSVAGVIRDKDAGVSSYTATVDVMNVAPGAEFNASTPVDEGASIELSLDSPSDPSSADVAAGFTYAFDCGDGFGPYSTSNGASCATTDDGERTVSGRIRDKDGGVSEYSATVTVTNIGPAATFALPGSVDEGGSIALSLNGVFDPSSDDMAAGFTYAFDCGDGTGFGNYGAANSTSCATTDNGDRVVGARVHDKDGGVSEYTASVAVESVAPTATLAASSPVDEGSAISLSFSDPSDPSSADTAAGFSYAFDCGDGAGFGGYGSSSSATCSTIDNGTRTVLGRIRDKDGGSREYSGTIAVTNVAPLASFTAPGAVGEGGLIALELANAGDPSSADTAAGFTYAFDCGDGNGYGPYGTANSVTCTSDDDGSRVVKGRVRDKDGGFSEYAGSVTVTNVAPAATLVADTSVDEGSSISVSLADASDPSSADTAAGFTYAFDCGDGNGYGPYGAANSIMCGTDDNGSRAVKGRVRDKDGGATEYAATVAIASVAPSATFGAPSPIDEGSAIQLSLTAASDPSSADAAAGFAYAFDCGNGFGSYSNTNTAVCGTDDDGVVTVHARIRDKDGAATEYGASVSVDNVAPTAVFEAPTSVDEGSPFDLQLIDPSDPSSADAAAGFVYAFDCGDGTGAGAFGSVSNATCATTDNGVRTVGGMIRDKDLGATNYAASTVVDNVAPSATFTASSPVDEGNAISLSFSDPSDPSSTDTAAGFSYAFDCGDGAGFGAYGSSTSAPCPTTDNGTRTVKGRIRDKDGGTTEYAESAIIQNVAPSATLTAPVIVSEGSPISLALTAATDPSSDDTAAGFSYAFDCGDGAGFGAYGSSTSAPCPTTDNGPRTVKGRIRDKDGGVSSYSVSVDVTNVAPTATFVAPSSVNEGSAVSLSLTGAADPASADTTAGFTYAFDCGTGGGFGAFSASNTASCATTDDGAPTVKGRVRDKDGGVSEYDANVSIVNVAPQIQQLAIAVPSGTACASNAVTVSFAVADPASQTADPIVGTIVWGDGTSTPISGRNVSKTHTYGPGVYSLTTSIEDGDGGTATAGSTNNVTLRYATSGFLQPINMDGSSTFKLGSTIPTKVRVTDCTGAPVSGLTLEVRLSKLGATSAAVNEVASSSAADNGNLMRYDGSGQYIFNLSTKRSQFNAGNDLTAGRYRLEIVGPSIATIATELSLRA